MVFQKKLRTRRFLRDACWPGLPGAWGGGGGGRGGGGGTAGGQEVLSCPWLGSFVEVVDGFNGSGFPIGVVQSFAESSAAVTLAMTSITLAMTPVLEGQAVWRYVARFL